jgi:hypothetical protein
MTDFIEVRSIEVIVDQVGIPFAVRVIAFWPKKIRLKPPKNRGVYLIH